MAEERWVALPGYEGIYEVSDQGQVRSWHNYGPIRPRVLRHKIDSRGYAQVTLCKDGGATTPRVHQLVLLAFVGTQPPDMGTRHIDGDASNNALTNLTYGTQSENIRDQLLHGTHHEARKTHCKWGHEFTPENTWTRGTQRKCKTCHRARKARALTQQGAQ
jgi:hypothetical protein